MHAVSFLDIYMIQLVFFLNNLLKKEVVGSLEIMHIKGRWTKITSVQCQLDHAVELFENLLLLKHRNHFSPLFELLDLIRGAVSHIFLAFVIDRIDH